MPDFTFKVSYVTLLDADGRKLHGRGLAVFTPDSVIFHGRCGALFGRRTEVCIPLEQIVNVCRQGALITFDRLQRGGVVAGRIALRVSRSGDAPAMHSLLPAATTDDFEEIVRQQQQFAADLVAAAAFPIVTTSIIVLNVLVFIAMAIAGAGLFAPETGRMLAWGADFWPLTTSGQWWRLLTSTFLHFGILHLLFNMWALTGVGPLVERLYGSVFFALLYLFGGVSGSLASTFFTHDVVSAGASGAVFAVYGALLGYLLAQRGSVPAATIQALAKSTLGFVGYNIVYGFGHTGIDNAAHLGGLAGGFLLGLPLARPLQLPARAKQAGPRLAFGAIAGAVAVALSVWFMPKAGLDLRQEEAFLQARRFFAAQERLAISAYNQLAERARAGALSDSDLAGQLEELCIPRWDGILGRLAAVNLSGKSPSKPLLELLVAYSRDWREGLRLLSDGLKSGDASKAAKGKTMQERAGAMLGEVERAAERAYPD